MNPMEQFGVPPLLDEHRPFHDQLAHQGAVVMTGMEELPRRTGWVLYLGYDAYGHPVGDKSGAIRPPGWIRRRIRWLLLGEWWSFEESNRDTAAN